ncbi:DUF1684 domain-containing protein [Streptomyces pactum]|uniref:DUF1684 domain-containing protein n=1 Tax=Streptomyces pactum TaxID=68249 RepID=A0ABS0NG63_9ACTN|nr:DUF1684 domain-containing protein [Streptomyces pactum]MBH5334142.1 DUF1684 domain-containing protein [Streptomyces pactum]
MNTSRPPRSSASTPAPGPAAHSSSGAPDPSAGSVPPDGGAGQEWLEWRAARTASVTAPYGPLALTGTHWLADAAAGGSLPGVPGRWTADGDEVVLTAVPADGLSVDGRPLGGSVRLGPDTGPDGARVARGEQRLVVLRREGSWAVRVFDPGAAARRAFRGIDVFAYDPRWAVPAVHRPYPDGREIRVDNADGRRRGLHLAGEVVFEAGGAEHRLAAVAEAGGALWIVFADGTSGRSSYRFRFLRPGTPAADGTLTLDFNRAFLPPCAFADHFICPFPPPGNTLPLDVPAGERNLTGD